jgi:cytochrome oxidase Cu insertion factor (SCO1/SenC/PrrC family)
MAVVFAVRYAQPPVAVGSHAEVDKSYLRPPPSAGQDWLADFTLTDQRGRSVDTAALRGQVYVTNFFFSSCPGTCLQQNQKIQEIERQYGPKGVRFLSITCDPDNDDPDRLREYASRLGADEKHWSFLTGQMLYTQRIASEVYQVHLEKTAHSERFFVTDKWGHVRGTFEWNNLAQITQLRLLLDKLLAETEEPAELHEKTEPGLAPADASSENAPSDAAPAEQSPPPEEN